jgi:hypothetical protein
MQFDTKPLMTQQGMAIQLKERRQVLPVIS